MAATRCFASQCAAYETLSPGMQRMLDGAARRAYGPQGGGPQAGLNANRSTKVREDAELARDGQPASRGAHPSGDRAQDACSSTTPTRSASRA